jgi:hypothetical protein
MQNSRYVPQFQVRSHVHSGQAGGYVNGVWYPDRSGICGGYVPQPNPPQPYPPSPYPPSGGGYVGGVWYADRSGVCG